MDIDIQPIGAALAVIHFAVWMLGAMSVFFIVRNLYWAWTQHQAQANASRDRYVRRAGWWALPLVFAVIFVLQTGHVQPKVAIVGPPQQTVGDRVGGDRPQVETPEPRYEVQDGFEPLDGDRPSDRLGQD